MKRLFSLLALCLTLCATTLHAQNSLLATLFHDGDVQTFYSASALREALNAAVDGDVITLSSGTFTAADITKAVTLRGAGMQIDSVTGTLPTIISGDFIINIADTLTHRLTIEGIYHNNKITYKGTLKNAMFLKSRFKDITLSSSSSMLKNASFIHCRIQNNLDNITGGDATFTNCYVRGFNY